MGAWVGIAERAKGRDEPHGGGASGGRLDAFRVG
jgi:hypothetical protein